MTIPACSKCNSAFSGDEAFLTAVVAHVSFEDDLMWEKSHGSVARSIENNGKLREFLEQNTDKNGIFQVTHDTQDRISRILIKTVQGLYYLHYGQIVPAENVAVLSIKHHLQWSADDLLDEYSSQDTSEGVSGWPEVKPDGKALERAILGLPMGKERCWVDYHPEVFRYTFAKGCQGGLICVLDLHRTLAVAAECPWPAKAGPSGGLSKS